MKTLPLVDSNMVSYSFIAALPLSLEEIIYLKTQRPLWNLPGSVLWVLGNGLLQKVLAAACALRPLPVRVFPDAPADSPC